MCKHIDKRLNEALENNALKVKTTSQELSSLSKLIQVEENRRNQFLNDQCRELKESHKKMKDKFNKIKARIETLESVLGYDSAVDRFMS